MLPSMHLKSFQYRLLLLICYYKSMWSTRIFKVSDYSHYVFHRTLHSMNWWFILKQKNYICFPFILPLIILVLPTNQNSSYMTTCCLPIEIMTTYIAFTNWNNDQMFTNTLTATVKFSLCEHIFSDMLNSVGMLSFCILLC